MEAVKLFSAPYVLNNVFRNMNLVDSLGLVEHSTYVHETPAKVIINVLDYMSCSLPNVM